MIIEKRDGGVYQRWNMRKYMDLHLAKRREGKAKESDLIPDHVMVGQSLEYKGKIYTVKNVVKNWYAGYYLSLLIEDENQSGLCLPHHNINSISDVIINSIEEAWEHIDFIWGAEMNQITIKHNQITITLDQIKAHNPCGDGWEKIVAATHLHGGDFSKPFPLLGVLDTNGLNDTLWALRCLPEHDRLWRKYAVWCARKVQHLMTDQRSINALDVEGRHADEMAAAVAAPTGWAAALVAARVAALVAARAAWAAEAARSAQAAKLRQILDAGEWVGGGARPARLPNRNGSIRPQLPGDDGRIDFIGVKND